MNAQEATGFTQEKTHVSGNLETGTVKGFFWAKDCPTKAMIKDGLKDGIWKAAVKCRRDGKDSPYGAWSNTVSLYRPGAFAEGASTKFSIAWGEDSIKGGNAHFLFKLPRPAVPEEGLRYCVKLYETNTKKTFLFSENGLKPDDQCEDPFRALNKAHPEWEFIVETDGLKDGSSYQAAIRYCGKD